MNTRLLCANAPFDVSVRMIYYYVARGTGSSVSISDTKYTVSTTFPAKYLLGWRPEERVSTDKNEVGDGQNDNSSIVYTY